MKILTPRNNKDYYDYLSGIYGIDENVVYDRREFNILENIDSPYFSKIKKEEDKPKQESRIYGKRGPGGKILYEYIGKITYALLEVGLFWVVFKIERYLDEKGIVNIDWTLEEKIEIEKSLHKGESAMTFFPDLHIYNHIKRSNEYRVNLKDGIKNPILRGSQIASMISPDEVYKGIYSYLSALNDKDIVDKRTDIQKAEAAGFDKITSFRNIK